MIVVSILADSFEELARLARAQVVHADAIELRFDRAPLPDELALSALVRSLERPVIAAVNGPEAFGTFTGTRDERCAILRAAARAGAAFVDVDWKSAPYLGQLEGPCRRIVSRHEVAHMPADLPRALAELRASASEGDRLKLVAHAERAEDGVALLELARESALDLVAFASGERGRFTRVLAPIFGSPFTYAAPARVGGDDGGPATAPGQLLADELRRAWPARGVSRSARVCAVVGKPARHSLSPRIHGAAMRAAGLDAVYVAIEPDDLGAFVARCAGPAWRGFSVTAPFKEAAFELARERDATCERARAANTLVREVAGWRASNTDAPAIRAVVLDALRAAERRTRAPAPASSASGANERVDLARVRVAVVGTGGAARAALVGLGDARLTVLGRDASKRRALATELGVDHAPISELAALAPDVLVHCTPAGSEADPGSIAVDPRALREGMVVLDAVYRPARTPLVAAAESAGALAIGGGEWFVRQALAQLERFHGIEADASVEDAMRTELARALAEGETR